METANIINVHRKHFTSCFSISRKETHGGVNYDFTCVQSSLVLEMSQHYYSQEIRSVVVITIIIMGVALSVYVQVHLIAGMHKLVHTFL